MTDDTSLSVNDNHEEPDNTLSLLEIWIKERINSFDERRKFYRTGTYRFTLITAGLSSITTILIGLGQSDSTTIISVISLITSASISFLTAWESLYGHRQRWIQNDEKQLWLLVRHAAILLDKCEYDTKTNQLRQIERNIAEEKNYDKIMQYIVQSTTETLKFKFVNISLIEGNHIKSKYIAGISKIEHKEFKKIAIHSLDSNDIQADIVKRKEIEVLDSNDPHLDPKIFEKFGHKNLIRVFIPMIEQSTNRVLGTIEAGYPKEYRKYIYEHDIEILKNFVNYAAQTLERKKTDLIDRITHEFKSPIVGIRSNASFMQRRFNELPDDLISKKFNNIIIDSEILLYQIGKLDYFMRGIKQTQIRIEKVFIFRDIFIKTIKQLRPTIIAKGFSIFNIEYPDNCNRISINTDKAKINQVVYNLLINSIKYSIKDPNQFKIILEMEDKKNN